MRWLSALQKMTENGIDLTEFDWRRLVRGEPSGDEAVELLGSVPIAGHGQLTGPELATAGASLEVRSKLPTIADLEQERERLEVFVERAATDVATRNLRGAYWDMQSAEVDENEEVAALAAEMDRLGYVESAAILGWVIRNAAVRAQRPIADLARATDEVSDDAHSIAATLLGSAQRLDPTYGGYVFALRPLRRKRLRLRDRFGDLWVYGD